MLSLINILLFCFVICTVFTSGSSIEGKSIATTKSVDKHHSTPNSAKNPHSRFKNICLTTANISGHSSNKLEVIESKRVNSKIPGVTYWINDFLAVGHMMYDISLLELVATEKIDSVVIQRAPCYTKDLCVGSGTMNTFFKTYFSLLTSISLNKKLLIYFRQSPKDSFWNPLGISEYSRNSAQFSGIKVADRICFSNLIFRNCQSCFHDSISPNTANKFQLEVKKLLDNFYIEMNKKIIGKTSPNTQISKEGEKLNLLPYIRITYGFRGFAHYRELYNPEALMRNISKAIQLFYPDTNVTFLTNSSVFPDRYIAARTGVECPSDKKQILLTLVDTSKFTDTYQQIVLSQTTDIMISTHGALESNLIYMRKGKTWIEITGKTLDRESTDFKFLAKAFGVTHQSVLAADLLDRKQVNYKLSALEEKAIIGYVVSILSPYISSNNATKTVAPTSSTK